MSNNNTPEFNNQNANEFANIINQLNPVMSRLAGQVRDFNRHLSDTARNAQQLEKEFEDTFRTSYQGFESLTQQLRKIDKEYKDLDRSIGDLVKQQEKLKDASLAASQAEKDALDQEIKQIEEAIRKRAESRTKIDEERIALENLSKGFGYQSSEIQKAARRQEELERITSRYGNQIKAASDGVGTLARSLANAAGFALSFDAVVQKSLSGFGRIKEVNRDFVALQANLANAGRVDLAKVTSGQLSGQSKRYRDDALKLVSDFGISFEEASKRIQAISSIRPTGSIAKEDWQTASSGLAELAGKLEVTTGLSTDVQRSLVKQDIQGYGRDTQGVSRTLLQASMAMKGLNMDSQEFGSTLESLTSRTSIYNTDARSLTTTLKNLGDMQLKANSAQTQAVAGYFGGGLAGQGFGDQLKTLQMIDRSGLSKELGITGKTQEERYAQLLEANQKNAQGVAAASLLGYSKSAGFSDLKGGMASFRLGATGQGLGLSQDQVTAFQGILLQNKGKSIEDIARGVLKPGPTEKEIQGQASVIENAFTNFRKLFVNPFQVSATQQEIGLGETFSGPLDAIGNLATQIPPQMVTIISLLGGILINSGLLSNLKLLGGGGLLKGASSGLGSLLGEAGGFSKITGVFTKVAPLLGKLSLVFSAFGIFDNVMSGFKEGGVKGLFTGLGARGKGGFEGALQGAGAFGSTGTLLGAGVGALFGGVGALPGAAIGGIVGSLAGAIAGALDIESLSTKIADGIESWWKTASAWLSNNLSNPVVSLLTMFANPGKAFFDWFLSIGGNISNFIKNTGDFLTGKNSGDVGGNIISAAGGALSAGAGALGNIINAAMGGTAEASMSGFAGKGGAGANAAVTYAQSQVGVSESGGEAYRRFAQGRVEAWCADFVSTVFKNAGVDFKSTSSVKQMYENAKKTGQLTSEAQSGYAVLYGDASKGQFKHTGIVESVNPDGTINTIEGNWKDKVSKRTIDPTKESIIGYVNPYAGMAGTSKTTTTGKDSYKKLADTYSAKYGIDPNVFRKLIETESQWNPNAKSKAGALGIAQLMPSTAAELGVNPMNPEEALDGSARYLKQQLSTFGGDYTKAVAAYNAGAGNVKKYKGIPPFKETQDYVSKVLGPGKNLASANNSTTIVQNFYGQADPDKVKNAARAALQERNMKKGAVQVKSAPKNPPLA